MVDVEQFWITEHGSRRGLLDFEMGSDYTRRRIVYTDSILDRILEIALNAAKDGKKPNFILIGGDNWWRLKYEFEEKRGLKWRTPVDICGPTGLLRGVRVPSECLVLGYEK